MPDSIASNSAGLILVSGPSGISGSGRLHFFFQRRAG